jgi:hypothetical protein
MRNVQVGAFVLLLLAAACVHSAEAQPTPDGRFGTPCYPSSASPSGELCSLSFYRLIASAERYHKKNVAVTGYLVKLFGKPVLFPSEASYRAGALSEGIALVDGSLPADIQRNLENGVFPVIVVGTFDAKHVGTGAWPLLGAFTGVRNVAKMVPLPNGVM